MGVVTPTQGWRSWPALPSSVSEVISASFRTTSSNKPHPTNKPLTLSLSLGLICCSVWGNPRGLWLNGKKSSFYQQ